jgi:nicotinamide-nucleotide amidase
MKLIESDIITLAKILVQKKVMLVTAESCTGGGLAYTLTSLPGSSQWFERGFITYSNEAKSTLLNVPPTLIEIHGAVSRIVAQKMAEGALENSAATISLSITGIAGPDGGTPEKPVGTVWFGLASKSQETKTFHQQFSGNRQEIRQQAIEYAIAKIKEIA